jgi:S-adenosylmethionine:diacylglycerol 3-amino-3-carboxypropyl transferase
MRAPHRRPLYSADNEDTRSELRALEPESGDLVVCVAAGGGRALSLLASSGGRFLAVDHDPVQLHVLELKAAALDALRYEQLRGFVGLDAAPERLDTYVDLRSSLSRGARSYWDRRERLVGNGILYAGRLETWLARSAAWLRRTRMLSWADACAEVRDFESQRAVLRARSEEIRRAEHGFALLMHPAIAWLAMRDPSFLRSTEGNPGRYLYRRLVAWAGRNLLRDSFLVELIRTGRYDPNGALPLWLTRDGSEQARKRLPWMDLVCTDIGSIPHRLPVARRVLWSLSDVSCWMSERRFHELLDSIAVLSPPGSRVCFRNLAALRSLPTAEGSCSDRPRLRSLDDVAAELDRIDTSVFYRFGVAEVRERTAR